MRNRVFRGLVMCGIMTVLLGGVAARLASAQAQPPVAINSQDEQLNINKEVKAETAAFTIFRSGDKAEINKYISEVVELKHAVAYEVLPHALKAVKREKGDARPLKYKDPASGAMRYFIQVVTTPEQMPSVIETIRALDLPEMTSSTGVIYYHRRLKYRRASEVANIINNTTLSGEGSLYADDVTNTLYIQESQSDGEVCIATAEFYDVPPPQVEFDVLAVEIEEDNASRLGLDWDAWKNALGGQLGLTANRFEGGEGFARLDALLTLDAQALASFLNYTTQTGTGKVVTRTRITASNNQPGVVSSLRRVARHAYVTTLQDPKVLTEKSPGVTAVQTDPAAAAGERTVLIKPATQSFLTNPSAGMMQPGASALDPSRLTGEKAEGIYLIVQPTIGTDMVTAAIRVVVNSLSGYTKLDEPILSERLLDTMVTLKDKEAFSLGGIDKETSLNVRRGIPLLKSIPGIQYLFSVESQVHRRSKVFLVLTPTFKNQVFFHSPVLLGKNAELTPMVKVNTDLAPPEPME